MGTEGLTLPGLSIGAANVEVDWDQSAQGTGKPEILFETGISKLANWKSSFTL
jgi:hypothetical protein